MILETYPRQVCDFSDISGLKLNLNMAPKKGRLLGQDLALEMASLPPKDYNHKWPKMKVKLLGVWFISIQSDIMMSANYSEKLEKIKSQLSCWKYR